MFETRGGGGGGGGGGGVELAYQNVGDAPGKTRIKTFKETNLGVVRVYVPPSKIPLKTQFLQWLSNFTRAEWLIFIITKSTDG